MKCITLITIAVALFWVNSAHAVQVFDVRFGNVQSGQDRSIPLEFDAADVLGLGDAGLDRDFPFNIDEPAPFKVNPKSGNVRKQINTTVNITLPSTTLIGVYNTVMHITVHGKNDRTLDVKVSATVLGFPFELTPPDTLDLGTLTTGTIKIKHIGASPESYTTNVSGRFFTDPINARINPGETQLITVGPGQLPDSGPVTDNVNITLQRTGETRTVRVKTNIVAKPDLVPSITAINKSAIEGGTNIEVTFVIQNAGFFTSVPCRGQITLDNDNVVDLNLDAIASVSTLQGLIKNFKTTVTGVHRVKVLLDTDNRNVEGDEQNNVATQDISIP